MKSMTGYGSAEGRIGDGILFAEVRSINSRFLDVNCKIPPNMYPLEPGIKKTIQNNMIRGKVEVFLKEKKELATSFELVVNTRLVKEYKDALNQIMKMVGTKASSHLLEVVDLKDLVIHRDKPVNIELYWKQISNIIMQAVRKNDKMRRKEGAAIRTDQFKRLNILERTIASIETISNARSAKLHKEAAHNTKEGTNGISSLLDRLDITEEITRLKSHLSQFRGLIKKNGAVGRQLDFLLQEMHREINTLGSKASDGKISSHVVEAKAELEKLREQAQNIE